MGRHGGREGGRERGDDGIESTSGAIDINIYKKTEGTAAVARRCGNTIAVERENARGD